MNTGAGEELLQDYDSMYAGSLNLSSASTRIFEPCDSLRALIRAWHLEHKGIRAAGF